MRSFPRARDIEATAPRTPTGPAETGRLAPRHSQSAGGPRTESRGVAVVRWAALALLLAVAGQAAASWPLAASARQAMPPRCAAVPAALTDDTQAQRAAPARQGAEPVAQAGFGWG
jgi:hypothetical protein